MREMSVRLLAHTQIGWTADWVTEILPQFADTGNPGSPPLEAGDYIAEFAGRACYKSFDRPNPQTAENVDYLRNILQQRHFSVLEHVHVVFYVEHVSRALLLELERHRFLSFSVESQRYVDQAASHPEPVIPPAMRGDEASVRNLMSTYRDMMYEYQVQVEHGLKKGLSKKQAREAARAFLPNATPTDFVVSANIRCWRDVLEKRLSPAADAEIREFAQRVLEHLRVIAPNSVQDIQS